MQINSIKANILRFFLLLTMLVLPVAASAQNRTVRGTVTDEQQETLPGATVLLKGTNTATVTDMNGKYTINIPDTGGAVLSISYVGYITQEITVKDRSVIDITMAENISEIEEVVVTGYGTQNRASVTGAISVISSKAIVTTKSDNIQNALTGKVAGVKVVEGTSEPGTFETDFSIRGQGEPLIIIDGVPRDNMTRLDPNEVETISILKDASAAVYGARAANGVVLITTRQGQRDSKFKFEYTGHVGTESFIKDMKTLDAIGFMSLMNERNFNRWITTMLPFGRSKFQPYEDGTLESTDWIGTFINKHPVNMQHSLNASGGTKTLNCFINFGYTSREGRWNSDATGYKRFNLRSNLTAQLAKGLEGKVMVNLMQERTRSQVGDTWRIYSYMVRNLPSDPIYLPDPVTGEPSLDYPYNVPSSQNPAMVLDPDRAGYDIYDQRRVQTNMSLEWAIPGVSGLKAKGAYSYDFRHDDNKNVRKMYTVYNAFYSPFPAGDRYIRRGGEFFINDQLQFSLSYRNSFGGNHNVNTALFYEESSRRTDNYWVRRNTVLTSVEELFAGSNTSIQGTQEASRVYHYSNKAVVGRFVYDYQSKYIADFSFRYDGSSKFGPGHQWGFFPVGSAAWRVSEESFIRENEALGFLTNLKLRASYGIMGDDRASSYQFVSGYEYPTTMALNYTDGYYVLNDTPTGGVRTLGTPNQEITWFTAKTLNIGLEFELWKGGLGGIFEIYRRNRSGLIATRQITLPAEGGLSLPDENIDSDQTSGVELTLTHRNKIGGLEYSFSAYGTMDRTMDKYVERVAPVSPYDNWKNNMNNRWSRSDLDANGRKRGAGNPANSMYWGTEYLGQFQSLEEIYNNGVVYDGRGNAYLLPGDLIYNDWNEDGMIDGNDDHPIGSRHTTLSYGFTAGAAYMGFDLSLTFQGTAGNRKMLKDISEYFQTSVGVNSSGLAEFADRWHRADEFNPSIHQEWIPGYYPSTFAEVEVRKDFLNRNSTFWIQNASFLRLKTIEAGYTLPSALTKKLGMSARLFFNGYNLFTFSRLRSIDPEQAGAYPLIKSYRLGITVTF
jgi:TonB-linked SusC/RagA family outer membrane protein